MDTKAVEKAREPLREIAFALANKLFENDARGHEILACEEAINEAFTRGCRMNAEHVLAQRWVSVAQNPPTIEDGYIAVMFRGESKSTAAAPISAGQAKESAPQELKVDWNFTIGDSGESANQAPSAEESLSPCKDYYASARNRIAELMAERDRLASSEQNLMNLIADLQEQLNILSASYRELLKVLQLIRKHVCTEVEAHVVAAAISKAEEITKLKEFEQK